jgi:hypothetical protein
VGDLERAPHRAFVKGIGTAFWSLVLLGSVIAIGIGFAGGRTYGSKALQPPRVRVAPPPPAVIAMHDVERALRGAGSLDAADDEPDRYGDPDRAVASRPAGWAPRTFDERHGRPRIAVVVVDADAGAATLAPFAEEPFPLAVLVAADADPGTLRAARDAGKTALVACGGADLAAIAALRRAGAAGIACSTSDPARAEALLQVNGGGIVLDDRIEGDELYHAARVSHRPALTRDVLVDARDQSGYVDFLFAQALAIGRRTGVATVALHARPSSLRALERFAERVDRDGAEIVDIRALAR